MYFCEECENYFEQCDFVEERHNLDTPPYEQVRVCPVCGMPNPSVALKCDKCGEHTYYARLEDGYCEECASDTKKRFKKLIISNFDKKDRKFLLYSAVDENEWGIE